MTELIDEMRSHVMALPDQVKFAVVVAAIVGIPRLAARIKLPPMASRPSQTSDCALNFFLERDLSEFRRRQFEPVDSKSISE